MDILKAIGALSQAAPQTKQGGEEKPAAQSAPTPPPSADGGNASAERENIMAQAIMRHEQIVNRVRSRGKKGGPPLGPPPPICAPEVWLAPSGEV